MTITSDNGAVMAGYTKEVLADSDAVQLHLLIKPETDLDGEFVAFCCDEQEMIRVNGWLFTFEEIRNV